MKNEFDRERLHFEPFVHLAGLDDDQALIAWGGFWFVPFEDGHGWRIIDDEELHAVEAGRVESIGLRSGSYGPAVVQAFDSDGNVAAHAETSDTNHVWLRGLKSDTLYTYRIEVSGRSWTDVQLMSWHRLGPERGELRPSARAYDLSFRTFPERESGVGIDFCAIGDYGVGIQTVDGRGSRQLDIARSVERAVEHHDLRLILTLGDNIYHAEGESVGGTGKEDDDWYFSFYEPYRWLISKIPVFPAVGNHDGSETEHSDDRSQLEDNHYLRIRFEPEVEKGRARMEPGLFYRLDYSQLVQFVCIDTSEPETLDQPRYFSSPDHQKFIDDSLYDCRSRRWRIPFCHHPPFCAGPHHGNDEEMCRLLVPRFEQSGVRLVLSGHEHNFQYAVHNDIHYVVSGAAGKLREGRPESFEQSHTLAWAAKPHFLVVKVDENEAAVWPVAHVDEKGRLECIEAEGPHRERYDEFPIRVPRRSVSS